MKKTVERRDEVFLIFIFFLSVVQPAASHYIIIKTQSHFCILYVNVLILCNIVSLPILNLFMEPAEIDLL